MKISGIDAHADSKMTVAAEDTTNMVSDRGGKISPDSGSGSTASFVTAADTVVSFATAVDDTASEEGWTTVGENGKEKKR